MQTGSQQTNGVELGVNGNLTRKWQLVGGYAYQNAFITSATTAAAKGALVADGSAAHVLDMEQLPGD